MNIYSLSRRLSRVTLPRDSVSDFWPHNRNEIWSNHSGIRYFIAQRDISEAEF